jgi:hypothetical protein
MAQQNELTVQQMSEDQRNEERQAIVEHFGPGIEDTLKRIRAARERSKNKSGLEAGGELMDVSVETSTESKTDGRSLIEGGEQSLSI